MNISTTRNGYNVPSFQHNDDYDDSKIEYIVSNSAQVPSFGGSQIVIDYKEYGTQVLQQWIGITVSAISTMTSGMFVPAQFFYNNIQILQNGNVIETLYPEDQFLQQQLFLNDFDRNPDNVLSGLYSSTARRTALATASNTYYVPLWNYVRQSTALVLNNKHELQFKITLNPLSQITSGTGTAVASISQIFLYSKVKKLSQNMIQELTNSLYNNNHLFFKFNDVRNATYPLSSGSSTADIVLNAFNGDVSLITFVVRPTSGLTGNGLFSFNAIQQFEIVDSTGKNLVGGVPISNAQALLIIGNDNCSSSYLTENSIGGATDNGANVYTYSFCNDVESTIHTGMHSGSQKFNGTERLKLTFPSALGSASQLDVYCWMNSGVEYRLDSVKKNEKYIH